MSNQCEEVKFSYNFFMFAFHGLAVFCSPFCMLCVADALKLNGEYIFLCGVSLVSRYFSRMTSDEIVSLQILYFPFFSCSISFV